MLGLLVWLVALVPVPAPDPPSPVACEVEITGMPVSIMRHHRLVVGADDERPLVSHLTLEVGDEALRLRVLGLRYHGDRWVSRQDCEATPRVVLPVQPLPARVVFPCPPKGLTVACPGCPGEAGQRVYLAEELPPVDMESWSREVTLVLRAPGYHREALRVELHPGPNSVHVELEAL
jgi:hypothetical protein